MRVAFNESTKLHVSVTHREWRSFDPTFCYFTMRNESGDTNCRCEDSLVSYDKLISGLAWIGLMRRISVTLYLNGFKMSVLVRWLEVYFAMGCLLPCHV